MKKILFILLGCSAFAVWGYAQEGLPEASSKGSVREDSFLIQKEMMVWPTSQEGGTSVSVDKCQVVRVHPKWFLTAAHCVYSACQGSLPCTVQITLAEGEMRQTVRIRNSTVSKNVFIYEGFFPGQNRISSGDVALIKLDPMSAEYSYEMWDDKKETFVPITQKQFDKKLSQSPETRAQLDAVGARLVSTVGLSNSVFLPQIVVPLMKEGNLSYLVSPYKDVFFVQKLQHFISPGFGVRKGNSGGGVFTAKGDLVGVVSSLVYSSDGSVAFKNDKGKTLITLENADDYFLFTGFNGLTMNFIRNHIPSIRTIGGESGFMEPTKENFSTIIKTLDRATLLSMQ